MCTVQWQDGTESLHNSNNLDPVTEVLDQNGFQPGDVVLPQLDKSKADEISWRPGKIGVIQSADPVERVASVLWKTNEDMEFIVDTAAEEWFLHGDCTTNLPAVFAPEGQTWLEEIPVYDIIPFPSLRAQKLDDFVTISWLKLAMIAEKHQKDQASTANCECSVCDMYRRGQSDKVDWFGRIMERRKDGLTVVRFGALEEVEDRALPIEVLMFAVSLMEYELEQAEAEADAASLKDSWSELESEKEFIDSWIENERGERLEQATPNEDDMEWDTVSEEPAGDDSDANMENSSYEVECENYSEAANKMARNDATQVFTASIDTQTTVQDPLNHKTEDVPRALPSFSSSSSPEPYKLLDDPPPSNHKFIVEELGAMTGPRIKRIAKEHKILAGTASLPEGVYVRGWEARLDLLRILIVGPVGTPYEHCPLLFDILLGADFPQEPPKAHFFSWTHASGRVNPNLYEEGKICLSLLNTLVIA
jgi:ubiquitin-conjugating enzyme E2 O